VFSSISEGRALYYQSRKEKKKGKKKGLPHTKQVPLSLSGPQKKNCSPEKHFQSRNRSKRRDIISHSFCLFSISIFSQLSEKGNLFCRKQTIFLLPCPKGQMLPWREWSHPQHLLRDLLFEEGKGLMGKMVCPRTFKKEPFFRRKGKKGTCPRSRTTSVA